MLSNSAAKLRSRHRAKRLSICPSVRLPDWEKFRGGFPRVLVVFTRFWEVFGGSERVGNSFIRFEEDFAGFSRISRGFEGLGGVRESSGRVPREVLQAF